MHLRPLAATAVLLALAATLHPAAAAPRQAPGTFARYSYADTAGAADYMLYTPPGHPVASLPLVVYIPGAMQTAEQAAHDTRLNDWAAAHKFYVLYPEAHLDRGGYFHFDEPNRHRGKGDAAVIAGITQTVLRQYPVDRAGVYVGGTSDGGELSNVMLATYPDLYAALFSHSGGAYGCDGGAITGCGGVAADVAAATVREMGPRLRVVPFLVFHGTKDPAVPPADSETLVQAWLMVDDVADDGVANKSVPQQPSRTVSGAVPGGGHNYTVRYYTDAGGCPLGAFWLISEMRHVYSGGAPNTPQGVTVDPNSQRKISPSGTDPLGPDASAIAYRFFLDHPMSSATSHGCRK